MNSAATLDAMVKQWTQAGYSKANIIVMQAQAMLGWPYVWGASGQDCTVEKRRYFMNREQISAGDAELIRKRCQVLAEKAASCLACTYFPGEKRTRIQDCQGFEKEIHKKVGITLSGAGATSMYDNNANWTKKGTIDQMPRDAVCLVFKRKWNKEKQKYVMEHVGQYLGQEMSGGNVIHCSVTVKWGNINTEKDWTHFAIPKGLEGGTPMPTHETLRKGATGPDVVECQNDLLQLGYDLSPYGADGKYGNTTIREVKKFQTASGLKADGICGPATWAALDAAVGPQPTPDAYMVIIHNLDKTQAEAIHANYPGSEIRPEGSDQK